MGISRWSWLPVLLVTAGLIPEIHGKCELTPLQGDRTIAYVCVNGKLADIGEIPSDAEWIEFTVSHLSNLPADAFARFPNLRRLTFYNCDLKELSPEAFRGLNELEWLVMSNTRINAVRAAQLRHLKNLRRLTLDAAGLVYIEPEVFHSLGKLETLSLRDNDLDCLPIEALGALKSLRTVQIAKNPWLCDCRYSLDKFFADRLIERGPGEENCVARNGTHVRRYWAGFTQASNYDCMTTLEYPDLPKIGMNAQDVEPFRKGRFEWREVVGTGIESLDKLPEEIVWIQLFNVPIPVLPRYAFFRFGNTLRSIELTNCGIDIIEPETFAGLHKLERLSLIGNRFITVGHGWFRDLSRLTDLVLRNNRIQRFDDDALIHLGALRRLDLTGNRLRCLEEYYLRGLVSLQKLQATDNPWLCDCRHDLERRLTKMRIGYDITSGRCDLPGQVSVTQNYNQTYWNWSTTTSGTIRWSWAYEVRRPSTPVIARPSTPYVPPRIPSTTPRPVARPRGCQLIRQSLGYGKEGKIESCLCTRGSLMDLDGIPDAIDTIVYSGSIIPTIHNDAFRKFGRFLKRLELRDCGIQNIERRAFYNLRILETLVIRGNDLDYIQSEWFEETTNLRRLDLSRNGITRISNGVFDKLPYLISLDVSDNRLNCIGIEHLESLRYLTELEISGNPWTCLCITRLVQLMRERSITCKCNPEALLQTSLGGWGCNEMTPSTTNPVGVPQPHPTTSRPMTTSTQPPMEEPPPFWTMSGSCYESHEPTKEFTRSTWYHCANGDISLLHKIPSYIKKIEIIDSYVPRLTPMTFARFENLTELVLRNCTLRDIDVQAFAGLHKLEKLTLRDNRFSIVKYGWFEYTRNLVWLDMSDNYLTEIEAGAFEGLDQLEYLNLEGNDFQCFYTSCLLSLPRLRQFEFARNSLKWRCWQELRQFLQIRAIGYTYYVCPHNGKDLVRNYLLKDEKPTVSSSSARHIVRHFPVVAILFIIHSISPNFYYSA
ncbi:slit homolog 2 protein-like [Venturia canescens]|uniref:slit homolog 2 protein-like n=1 Tax=Venturia canescens TaxID=32260 RepID=UPI001C9D1A3F|nr:slit homolog 2 protein-like [Venturia canescens]